MNWPGFYALGGAWLFLLAIPLVIFYFLKLKRPRREIPSLALWRQVINDRRVNSPFQKFKRNLLLLLQLLLLLLLVLAAMQPFVQSEAGRAENLPILIDCSASMAALDRPGGTTRLQSARQQVSELIDNLLPDQQVSLIAVHSTARRITEFTNNKRLLHNALEKITVVDVPSNLEDGLRMTQALARGKPINRVLLYSDGNFPPRVDFELPFELNYQQLPAGGPNVGITAFNARRSGANSWDVFVRLAGGPAGAGSADLELLRDGQPVATDSVLLEEGESGTARRGVRLVFGIESDRPAALEVRLLPDGFDSLPSDNVAFLDLPAPRPLAAFCHAELPGFRHALQAVGGIDLDPADDGTAGRSSYDVLITDRKEDLPLEATVSLFVGMVPQDLQDLLSLQTGSAEVVDWERSAPLLEHVQLTAVQIADVATFAEGIEERHLEELGYEILAHGRSGPLILRKRDAENLAYYLLFHTDRSTLPYRIGFPILVTNLARVALRQANLSEVRGNPTEVLPPIPLESGQSYRVTAPDGEQQTFTTGDDGILSGVPAPLIGRYRVTANGGQIAAPGVSLLNAMETELKSAGDLQFRELSVAAAAEQYESDVPLWPALVLAAFAALLVEWWYFQKRPGGSAV